VPDHRELAPPAHLSDAIECIWFLRQADKSVHSHRVVPDGCADILFTRSGERALLQVVGPMTKFEDYPIAPGALSLGIRFRPGMWTSQFQIPGDRITNTLVPLEDIWGARARTLLNQMWNANSIEGCVTVMARSIRAVEARSPAQRAIAWMERSRGQASMDWLAQQSGLSSRQFRRVCMQQTGLLPKFLARVLRFRHALSKVSLQAGEHAGLAAECGYTDQSHFIAEFRQFSGETPSAYLRSQV
jgi:AraC-like DNA-binding protein